MKTEVGNEDETGVSRGTGEGRGDFESRLGWRRSFETDGTHPTRRDTPPETNSLPRFSRPTPSQVQPSLGSSRLATGGDSSKGGVSTTARGSR